MCSDIDGAKSDFFLPSTPFILKNSTILRSGTDKINYFWNTGRKKSLGSKKETL